MKGIAHCDPFFDYDWFTFHESLRKNSRDKKRRTLRKKHCSLVESDASKLVFGEREIGMQASLMSIGQAKKFIKLHPEHKENLLKCVDYDFLGSLIEQRVVNPRSTYTHKLLEAGAKCVLDSENFTKRYALLYTRLKKHREK